MPDEPYMLIGTINIEIDEDTKEFSIKDTNKWAVIPEQELKNHQFVPGIGLVITTTEALYGRINYEGKVYSIERVDPEYDKDQFIKITEHEEGKEPVEVEYKFMTSAKVFVEDVDLRTVEKRTGYLVTALRAGGAYTLQNWEEVLQGTAPRWELPVTTGTRFDREVMGDGEP